MRWRIVAAAIVGAGGLALGVDNGAVLGILALVAAFGSEAVLLAVRLRQLDRGPGRLFEG